MADVALVHLGIDSSGVVAGEKAATQAFAAIERAMGAAEKSFSKFNSQVEGQGQKAATGFNKVAGSVSGMGSALQGLSGPIGSFSGQIAGVVGQVQSVVGAFGLIGGVTLAAAAGVAALGAAFTRLVLDGSKVSDQMLDIAETTNLGLETVQRFAAGMAIAGESPAVLERAFKEYQSAVVEAQDETTQAARAFKVIGVDAKAAGKDIIGSFTESAQHVKEYRQTVAGAEATNIIYGRTAGTIARAQDAVTLALTGSRKELEDRLIIAMVRGVEAGGRLDTQINKTSNAWSVFKQNMAGTTFGGVVEGVLKHIENGLIGVFKRLKEIEQNPTWRALLLGAAKTFINPTGGPLQNIGGVGTTPQLPVNTTPVTGPKRSTGKPTASDKLDAGDLLGLLGGKPEKAAKIDDAAKRAEEALQKARLDAAREGSKLMQEQWDKDLVDLERFAKELNTVLVDGLDTTLVGVGRKVGEIAKGVPLAPGGPGLIQQGGPGQPFPGAPIFDKGPDAHKIRTEQQAALDEQFQSLFDDFLVSILTARATVGEAFKGLALGIVDTFAQEFVKSLHTKFITPMVQGLTDLLTDALGDLFKGLSGAGGGTGLKGIFGGLIKGVGTIFGGLFATGGTLGPGKFGIAGERGPELIFSGSQPMHIAPVTAGSAGNVFNINVGVHAPQGTVDRRTHDQLAATVLNAVRRAERNQGAR